MVGLTFLLFSILALKGLDKPWNTRVGSKVRVETQEPRRAVRINLRVLWTCVQAKMKPWFVPFHGMLRVRRNVCSNLNSTARVRRFLVGLSYFLVVIEAFRLRVQLQPKACEHNSSRWIRIASSQPAPPSFLRSSARLVGKPCNCMSSVPENLSPC